MNNMGTQFYVILWGMYKDLLLILVLFAAYALRAK